MPVGMGPVSNSFVAGIGNYQFVPKPNIDSHWFFELVASGSSRAELAHEASARAKLLDAAVSPIRDEDVARWGDGDVNRRYELSRFAAGPAEGSHQFAGRVDRDDLV